MEPESTNTGAPASGLVEQLQAALQSALDSARRHGERAREHRKLADKSESHQARDLNTAELISRMLREYDDIRPNPGIDVALPHGVAVQVKAPQRLSADEEPSNTREAVFWVLARADGPLTTGEIVERVLPLGVGSQAATVRSVVSKMAEAEQIKRVRRGIYELAEGAASAIRHDRDGQTVAGHYRASAGGTSRVCVPTPPLAAQHADTEPDDEVAGRRLLPPGADREVEDPFPGWISDHTTVRPTSDFEKQADQEEEDYDEEYPELTAEDYAVLNDKWEQAALEAQAPYEEIS